MGRNAPRPGWETAGGGLTRRAAGVGKAVWSSLPEPIHTSHRAIMALRPFQGLVRRTQRPPTHRPPEGAGGGLCWPQAPLVPRARGRPRTRRGGAALAPLTLGVPGAVLKAAWPPGSRRNRYHPLWTVRCGSYGIFATDWATGEVGMAAVHCRRLYGTGAPATAAASSGWDDGAGPLWTTCVAPHHGGGRRATPTPFGPPPVAAVVQSKGDRHARVACRPPTAPALLLCRDDVAENQGVPGDDGDHYPHCLVILCIAGANMLRDGLPSAEREAAHLVRGGHPGYDLVDIVYLLIPRLLQDVFPGRVLW